MKVVMPSIIADIISLSFSALVIPPSPGRGLQVYKCQLVTRTSRIDGLVAFRERFCHDPVLE